MSNPDPYSQPNPYGPPAPNQQQPYGAPVTPGYGYGPTPGMPGSVPPGYPAQQPYGYQPPVAPPPAQRNKLVFVVSIIMIVGGAIGLITNLAAASAILYVFGGVGIAVLIVSVILGVVEIIAGILGVRGASDPAQGQRLFTLGIALLALAVVMMIVNIMTGSVGATAVVGLLLPILFVVGANQLRQRA